MALAWRRARTAFRRRRDLSRRWAGMPAGARADFLRFVVLIPALRLSLRVFGFNRTYRLLDRIRVAPTRGMTAIDATLVAALRRARRYAPYRGNCLPQSLALWSLLRRRGLPAELQLGARLDRGTLAAHAWVELEGRVLNDAASVRERFAPFTRMDGTTVASWS